MFRRQEVITSERCESWAVCSHDMQLKLNVQRWSRAKETNATWTYCWRNTDSNTGQTVARQLRGTKQHSWRTTHWQELTSRPDQAREQVHDKLVHHLWVNQTSSSPAEKPDARWHKQLMTQMTPRRDWRGTTWQRRGCFGVTDASRCCRRLQGSACPVMRKSPGSTHKMLGRQHTTVVSLSSGESEFCVEQAGPLRLSRRGAGQGQVRHIQGPVLWLQQATAKTDDQDWQAGRSYFVSRLRNESRDSRSGDVDFLSWFWCIKSEVRALVALEALRWCYRLKRLRRTEARRRTATWHPLAVDQNQDTDNRLGASCSTHLIGCSK